MKIVIGGGISGLTAAYYLRQKFPTNVIRLYESSNELGGLLKSKRLPNGTVFEYGPRTLRPIGVAAHETLQLIDDLGLTSKIQPICGTHPAATNRIIYSGGKLHLLPTSISELFKKISPFSKPLFFYLLRDLFKGKQKITENDESIYSFVERRFGAEIADYIISPLICGICAGDAKQISVKFLMESLFKNEQKYGSVVKGYFYNLLENGLKPLKVATVQTALVDKAKVDKWRMYTLAGGMKTLPETLEQSLKNNNVDLILNHTCKKINFCNDSIELTFEQGQESKSKSESITKHLITSIPASQLASLMQHQHPDLAKLLEKITSVTVAVVNLHYNTDYFLDEAFGFLVPPRENLPILGVIYDSCTLKDNTGTVLTVMMGGHWFSKYFNNSEINKEYLLNTATKHVKDILKIDAPPDNYEVNVLKNCIPQYSVGHYERLEQIENYVKQNRLPLSICGASYHGIGINDVIYSSKLAVDKIQL